MRMILNELPQWDECREAIKSGGATALHTFIFDQEPAGVEDENRFRLQLLAVINEIEGEPK